MSQLYPAGRQGILGETVRLRSRDIRVLLVSRGYRFARRHRVVEDLGEFVNGRSAPLEGKEFTEDGAFKADPTELVAEAEAECAGLVVYQDAEGDGDDDRRLIAHLDDVDGFTDEDGKPVTVEAGQAVQVRWAGKVFSI